MIPSLTSRGRRALRCFSLAIAAGVLSGCPAPPPDPGPPPSPPDVARIEYPDTSDEPPAPVLPDPRASLPAIDEAPAPAREADSAAPPANARAGPAYSVQVFASEAREGADAVAQRVGAGLSEPVEVVHEPDGMWRVYAGSAASRGSIDALRDRLRAQGFPEAWTKRRGASAAPNRAVAPLTSGPVYSVQVFAADNEANARRVADAVRSDTPMAVFVERDGALWKVYVGRSSNRGAVDSERDRLRVSGYPDAWTTRR